MSTIPLSAVEAFLHAEARALDDRDWDTWLAFYALDASFWMPAWDEHYRLVGDPQSERLLFYYVTRSGLEDRVFRIKTERSSASTPEPRTSHNISNVEILSKDDSKIDLRFNWLTLSYRYKIVDTYFGVSFYTLEITGERPLIKAKKVVLK